MGIGLVTSNRRFDSIVMSRGLHKRGPAWAARVSECAIELYKCMGTQARKARVEEVAKFGIRFVPLSQAPPSHHALVLGA